MEKIFKPSFRKFLTVYLLCVPIALAATTMRLLSRRITPDWYDWLIGLAPTLVYFIAPDFWGGKVTLTSSAIAGRVIRGKGEPIPFESINYRKTFLKRKKQTIFSDNRIYSMDNDVITLPEFLFSGEQSEEIWAELSRQREKYRQELASNEAVIYAPRQGVSGWLLILFISIIGGLLAAIILNWWMRWDIDSFVIVGPLLMCFFIFWGISRPRPGRYAIEVTRLGITGWMESGAGEGFLFDQIDYPKTFQKRSKGWLLRTSKIYNRRGDNIVFPEWMFTREQVEKIWAVKTILSPLRL